MHRYILPPVYKDPNHRIMTRDLERERGGGREKSGCFLYGLIVRPSSCCHGAYRSEVWDGLRSTVGERETERNGWEEEGNRKKGIRN